jgi:hypothetical protein
VKFILYVVKFICFVRLEFKDVFELSTIISVMDMIAVIIDQGYMVSFGSSRLLAWIQKKNMYYCFSLWMQREKQYLCHCLLIILY